MRAWIMSIALVVALLIGQPASAADVCHELPTQFGKLRHCVTSVRTAQGNINYGPDNLAAMTENSWCAAAGSADSQPAITLYQTPPNTIRTLFVASGFEKSDNAARQGRRIKRAMIETDAGFRGYITLRDSDQGQKVLIPKSKLAWIKLTVLETYPGVGYPGVCVSQFLPDAEEFNK